MCQKYLDGSAHNMQNGYIYKDLVKITQHLKTLRYNTKIHKIQ